MGKKKDPKYITQHNKLYKHAKQLVATATHTHSEAYNKAVDKHLMKDGLVDFDLLDKEDVQKKFVDTMGDIYISKAKQQLKVKKDLNDLEKDMLMQAYSGTTKHELRGLVQRKGKDLDHISFTQEAMQRYIPVLQQNLYASAGQHIEDKNINDIVKYVGLDKKVDSAKLDVMETRALLRAHHDGEGSISDGQLRQIIPRTKHKKKKKS